MTEMGQLTMKHCIRISTDSICSMGISAHQPISTNNFPPFQQYQAESYYETLSPVPSNENSNQSLASIFQLSLIQFNLLASLMYNMYIYVYNICLMLINN